MNTVEYIRTIILPATFALLPPRMNSIAAAAEILAIGFQESRFTDRRQRGGPARGFWQFEKAGISGVLTHHTSRIHVLSALRTFGYDDSVHASHEAIVHNDVLACVYARLLLWTAPAPLPIRDQPDAGWRYYLDCWRPGKPHRETWDGFFARAWELVEHRQ